MTKAQPKKVITQKRTSIKELPTDGERYLPNRMNGRIAAEHLARYSFAEQFIAGKKVLDVASGEGYGTAVMASRSRSIVGVDIAEDAIQYAQEKYASVKKATFQVGDVTSLEFPANAFDVIVCYETVEHVDAPSEAIDELRRVLRKDGKLIVSTPNKENYSNRFEYDNPFHKKELDFIEFKAALESKFTHVRYFGQFSGTASSIVNVESSGKWPIPDADRGVTQANVPKWTNNGSKGEADPLYYIAVCSNAPIENQIQPMEFFDASDWSSIEDEFRLRRTGEQLQAQIDSVETTHKDLQVKQSELLAAQKELTASLETLRQRDAEIQTLRLAFNSLRGQHTRLNKEIESEQQRTAQLNDKLNAILGSTTWRAGSAFRNTLMRSNLLRKTVRKVYLSIATKR
ncbi:methyltransferase domain-containing protein [Phyllobacterium sp. LjRoot231]|uniref:class I SAM-dependent methyltransferase n=1 Tax=Phyllobacterium sp. LjRoot231 TaxID=3342289 RepID=UPI003ECC2685